MIFSTARQLAQKARQEGRSVRVSYKPTVAKLDPIPARHLGPFVVVEILLVDGKYGAFRWLWE